MKTTCVFLGAAALSLSACMANAADRAVDTQAPATSTASTTPTAAMPYLAAAGASDLYEIESSRLALENAEDPEIQRFAQMMIDHHTQTTQSVTAAARSAGLTPPSPSLMPMQQRMIDELRPLSGDAFESMYVTQQRQAHDMALTLHQTYAEDGDTAELRQAANSAVPIIQQHIQELQQF